MRDIPKDRRLAGFPWVAMPGIHTEVLEVRTESQTWEEFEGRLLEKYRLDDALRLSKRDFMEWVETPEKGRNASVLLREFEGRFAPLSALDRTILDTGRVLLFVKAMDVRDWEQVGLVLETDDGPTTDWAMVKIVFGRFDKRRESGDKGSSRVGFVAARKLKRPPPARREETRDWLKTSSTLTSVVNAGEWLQIGGLLKTMTPDAAWTREEANRIRKKAYRFFLRDGSIWKHPKRRDGVPLRVVARKEG